eukprot:105296_1
MQVYDCDIRYGIWDCINTSSPCRDLFWFTHEREDYICDDNAPCNDDYVCTPETTGDRPLWDDPLPSCNLLCIDDGACSGVHFTCTNSKHCNVICSGNASCDGLIVKARGKDVLFPDYFVNIVCGKNGNNASCINANIVSDSQFIRHLHKS